MNEPLSRASLDFDLESTLPYLLNRAGVHIGQAFSEEIKRFRVTLPMFRILASLFHADDQSLTELAEHTSLEISRVSRLVGSLQRRGRISQKRSGVDGRAVVISLTTNGRNLALEIIPIAQVYERVAIAGIDPADIALMKRLLVRMYQNILALGSARPLLQAARAARTGRKA